MSRVAPAKVSFNGGEISRRLSARTDQAIYDISCDRMVGFAPLVEGGAEAMPGTIHVATAPGPFRPIRFQYSETQGHVIEASDGLFRVYTNDTIILDEFDAPLEIESPYSWAQVQALATHMSYDVLYCFDGEQQPRQFVRYGAADFGFELLELENGPFEPRNKDESITVSASALEGTVTLAASEDLFAATDVGSLFRMEARDFGDIPSWEPGISVTNGQLLTWAERVYRVVGGTGRTGGVQPIHTEGVEWDGMGTGTDVNGDPAPGVQLEYIHDKTGVLRITGFTDAQTVTALVLRHLPFSSVNASYTYTGGYWDIGWGDWTPPVTSVTYAYGTWRWSFGAFSDTRGWPQCGTIWGNRLVLAKGTTIYASVAGDLKDFATLNEFGEVTPDMAFIDTIDDPNPIRQMVADDRLLLFSAGGMFALRQMSAAQPLGPGNTRLDRQNSRGIAAVAPASLDSRTLYVGRDRRRIYEADFDAQRDTESPLDLTRYARHIGKGRFTALAAQQHPFDFVWACLADGTLACAAYLPEEDVLGWARRVMAEGVAARGICSITDPEGEFDQVWIAAEYAGGWHMLRMAAWREDGDYDDTACMVDMAAERDGAPATSFNHPVLRDCAADVVADGHVYRAVPVDGSGNFTLRQPHARVVCGLPFEAAVEGLPWEAGGDSGPAMGKMASIGRAWVKVVASRGLRFGAPGRLRDLEQLEGDSQTEAALAPGEGFYLGDRLGDGHTRTPRLRVERVAPTQATVLAWGCTVDVQQQ